MKKIIYLAIFVGSSAGGYLPTLWGASFFSMQAILFSLVGAILGIWGGYKLAQFFGVT